MNPNQDPDQLELLLLTTEELQRQFQSLQSSNLGQQLKGFETNVSNLRELNRKLVWRQSLHQLALLVGVLSMSLLVMAWFNMEWRENTQTELILATERDYRRTHPIVKYNLTLSPLLNANEEEWSQIAQIGTCLKQRKTNPPKEGETPPRCLPKPRKTRNKK